MHLTSNIHNGNHAPCLEVSMHKLDTHFHASTMSIDASSPLTVRAFAAQKAHDAHKTFPVMNTT